ncbi:hypothetical protein VVD49_05035 [Uliginosibacterium sp. H3]|uniref:Uncharacterized protein n=1 Tax=Uliginosibacterium silvisoli TaxID=3114758 RepID=A0ABU6K0U5_9RHOO|nr:hypothetical protein [Uliginosibacterium sp. H3]
MRLYGFPLLFVMLVCAMSTAGAQTSDRFYFYSFRTALASPEAREVLNPAVRLYWGAMPAPELGEQARRDTFSGTEKNSRVFIRSEPRDVCMRVFAKALHSFTVDAIARGYDAVVNIKGETAGAQGSSDVGFDCDAGYQITTVRLTAQLALTKSASDLAAEIERDPARWVPPKRTVPLSKNAIILSLQEILDSSDARQILGSIKTHVGLHHAPAYSERWGPEEYGDDARISEFGTEGACKKATLLALASMVSDVKEQGYNGIIKIQSYLDGQPAGKDTDLECEVDRKSASVNLKGTLVTVK